MRNYVCELSVHFSDEFMVFILILCLSEYNVMFVFLKLFYLFIYFNNVGPIRVSLHHYTNTFWCATISISFQGFPAPPPQKNPKKNPQKMLWLSKLFNRLLMKPLCHSLAIGHMPREAELLEQTGKKNPTAIHYRNDMRSYSCSIHAPSASSLLSATPWNVDRCKGQQLIYHAEALWP